MSNYLLNLHLKKIPSSLPPASITLWGEDADPADVQNAVFALERITDENQDKQSIHKGRMLTLARKDKPEHPEKWEKHPPEEIEKREIELDF